MDRPTITTLTAGAKYTTSTLNANFTALRDAFDNLVGRTGTSGSNNALTGNLDVNSKSLINVGGLRDAAGNDIVASVLYAKEWANKAVSSLVSAAAGGDQVDDYSALHHATAAGTSATAAAASATTASTQATTATTQASSATSSANAAAGSATTADNAAKVVAFRWNYDTSTTMADPGTGDIRFNNATLSAVTAAAISDLSGDTSNPDVSVYVLTWDDSTNTTLRGTLIIRKVSASQNFAIYNVSGASTDNAGWTQLALTYVTGAGTFASTDALSVQFLRTGNAGAGDLLAANNLSDVASAATSRTNLGLGTMATQAASAVAITGGTVTGITDLVVADGGTGASTFTDAGVLIGNGTGAVQVTSAGTAGQVLTSNGAGVDPTFQAAPDKLKQMVSTLTGAVATGTTVLPFDDTIPQNDEGDQYMSLAITPTSATNNLLITISVSLASSVASNRMNAALFQDSVANALAVQGSTLAGANETVCITYSYIMVAGTTSATTFKVRCGGGTAGTTTFNGIAAGRELGGVMASSIVIQEIKP